MSGQLHAERNTDRKCPPDGAAKRACECPPDIRACKCPLDIADVRAWEGLGVPSGCCRNEGQL